MFKPMYVVDICSRMFEDVQRSAVLPSVVGELKEGHLKTQNPSLDRDFHFTPFFFGIPYTQQIPNLYAIDINTQTCIVWLQPRNP